MANEVFIARQDTLESVKSDTTTIVNNITNVKNDTSSIKTDTSNLTSKVLDNKNSNIINSTGVNMVTANTYYDAVSVTGAGYLTGLKYNGISGGTTYTLQIIIDGVTTTLETFSDINVWKSISCMLRFKSSLRIQFKNSNNNAVIQVQAFLLLD